MHLSTDLQKKYTTEQLSAREAQRLAEFIAWGPAVFQASRLMIKYGILDMLRNSTEGMTREEIVERTGLSDYAVKCLMEASLCIGTVLLNENEDENEDGLRNENEDENENGLRNENENENENGLRTKTKTKKKTDRFTLSKTGWFLLNDPATRVNIDFNHDVNYEGWFHLDESLREGKPVGLKHFGPWPTVYEGLSSLPEHVQKSWFGFDHFYSDSSFPEALEIVFRKHQTRSLYDVGGNTGKWALQCVGFDKEVEVTILDLPQQIEMMRSNTAGKEGGDRIKGHGINLLDANAAFPVREGGLDAIWMSQFLDCFSMNEIISILTRAKAAMTTDTRLYIMETLWDRQRFEPAAFCLTMTSLYFTAIANGNSKMYNTEDMEKCINDAGLKIEKIHDGLGQGHSVIVCKLA